MKITVIGGSGFIGSFAIPLLAKDNDVTNVDKNTSSTYPTHLATVLEPEQLRVAIDSNTEWIVLLAAEHRDDVTPTSLYYDVNVQGAKNVLDIMRNKGIRKILFTSTVAVYGLNKNNPDEDFPVEPFNHYGKSKWEAEEVLRAWHKEQPDERSLVILRPTVVFGPGNRGNVYNLLQQILKGNFKMVGNGKNIKSMSYVENVAAFIRYALENVNGYQLFNYVDKPDFSTEELIQQIGKISGHQVSMFKIPYFVGYTAGLCFDILSKITGRKYDVSSIRIKKFCSSTQFSNKAVRATNFEAPHTLQKGLETTIDSLMLPTKQ